MFHNCKAVVALPKEKNDTTFQKTLGSNDFYLGSKDYQRRGGRPALPRAAEDHEPHGDGRAPRAEQELLHGHEHPGGRVRAPGRHLPFGTDPASSVLDVNCKAHELDNLYVVDTSFFPSIGTVNPALTAMANALRWARTYWIGWREGRVLPGCVADSRGPRSPPSGVSGRACG